MASGAAHAIVGTMIAARGSVPLSLALVLACGGESTSSSPPRAEDESVPAPVRPRASADPTDDAQAASVASRWKDQLTPSLPETETVEITFHEAKWQAGTAEDRALALDATLEIVAPLQAGTEILVRIACEHEGRTWLGSAFARHDGITLGETNVIASTGRLPIAAVVDLPAPAGVPARCELDARLVPDQGRIAQMQSRACWTSGTAVDGACTPALPVTPVEGNRLAAIGDLFHDGPIVEYTLDVGRRLPAGLRLGTRIACPVDLVRRPVLELTTLRWSAVDPGQSVRVRGRPKIARGAVRSGPCDVRISAYDDERVASGERAPQVLFVGCVRDTDIETGPCHVGAPPATDRGAEPATLHELTVDVSRADEVAGTLLVRGRLLANVAPPRDAKLEVESECRSGTRYAKHRDTPSTTPVGLEHLDAGDSVDFEVSQSLLGAPKGWWCEVSVTLMRGAAGPPVVLDERCVAMADAHCPTPTSITP